MSILISETSLRNLFEKNKKFGETIFPELIKRLILASKDRGKVRIPSGDAIWASGYDGILYDFASKSDYVPSGNSVWEFGTNDNYYKKINDDYQKRTDGADLKEKQNYSFILCTPQIWCREKESIASWCEKKNYENVWKGVYVYDATILATWLDEHPDIISWLYSSFEETYFAKTLKQKIDEYNADLIYGLNQQFFTNSNGQHIEMFSDLLDSKARAIKIRSPYGYEHALQFVMGALDSIENDNIKNSIVFVDDVESLKKVDELSSDKIVVQPFINGVIPSENNIHIILLRNSDLITDADIELDYCYGKEFVDSLISCGIDSQNAYELSETTGNNPISLARKIIDSSIMALKKPGWVGEVDNSYLIPLLIMGTINFDDASDKTILTSFGIPNTKEYKNELKRISTIDDSPIIKAENIYSISSQEEVFKYCDFDEEDVNKIYNLIENEIRTSNGINNKKLLQSSFDALLWINALNDKYIHNNIKLIDLMLDQDNFSNSLDYLRFAAELDRTHFIDKILGCIDQKTELNDYLHSKILPNKYKSTQLLSALDVCARFKDTAVKTINVLLKICSPDDEEINERLLLYLNPISSELISLTAEERKEYISRYAANETLLRNLYRLFPGETSSYWVPYSARRIKEENDSTINLYDVYSIGTYAIETLIDKKYNLNAWLGKFINSTDFMPLDECKKIFIKLENWVQDLSDEEKAELKPIIIKEIQNTREFAYSENWKVRQRILPLIKDLLRCCEPYDTFMSLRYLFNTSVYAIPIENPTPFIEGNNCIEENEKIRNDTIIEAIKKIHTSYGGDWWKLIFDNCGKDFNFSWDIYEESDENNEVIQYLINKEMVNQLSSILCKLDDSKIIVLFEKFREETFVKSIPTRQSLLSLLNEEQEKVYWSNRERYFCRNTSEEDFMFEKLIKYNPIAIVNSYYFSKENFNREKVVRTLKAIDSELNNTELWYILELLKGLELTGIDDEVVQLEFKFSKYYGNEDYPTGIKEFYWQHPEKVAELIQEALMADNYNQYYELSYSFNKVLISPQHIFDNNDALLLWFDSIVKKLDNNERTMHLAKQVIYKILLHDPDAEKTCPSECASSIFEKLVNNRDDESSVAIMFLNSRGARTVERGFAQKEFAKKYREYAQIRRMYIHTSNILKMIADDYEMEGNSDFKRSILNSRYV